MAVLGVDGWRGAWVGALLDGRSVRILHLASVADVLAVPHVSVVGIDMPIGLSEDGIRACDLEARRRLSGTGAASTVFPAPVRPVLAADSYVQARGLAVAASRRSISAQSWNLVPSIRDSMTAIRWGREEIRPHMPFVQAMCAPIPILGESS